MPPQSRAAPRPAAPPPMGGPPPAPGGRAKAPPPPAPQASPMRPTGAPPAPPAEAPPPERKSRGVIDTLRDMLTPSRGASGASKSDEAGPKTPRKLRARVVRRAGKRLVLEFTVDKGGSIDWRTDATSQAHTKGGETASVAIVAHESTAVGSVPPGGAILVAIDLPAEDVAIAEVRIELTSCTLVLTIA